jgi:hypothetical protein
MAVAVGTCVAVAVGIVVGVAVRVATAVDDEPPHPHATARLSAPSAHLPGVL